MDEWLVRLTIDQEHGLLDELCEVHTAPLCTVERTAEGDYYLCSTDYECAGSLEEVRVLAERHLAFVNVLMQCRYGHEVPRVRVASIAQTDPEDGRVASEHVSLSRGIRLFAKDPTFEEPGLVQDLLDLYINDDCVTDILELWGCCPHDWGTMCKVIEVVKRSGRLGQVMEAIDVAGDFKTTDRPNETARNTCERLKRVANSPNAIGVISARHGTRQEEPPPDPLSLQDAQRFAFRLLMEWLRIRIRESEVE